MGWIANRIKAEHRKHKTLNWEEIAEAKIKATIMDWCYKNNAIPMKDLYPELETSNLKLATTNGGWVNVIKLKEFMEGE
jgi:hypothetical protein